MVLRAAMGLLALAGVLFVVAALFRPRVDLIEFAAGWVLIVGAALAFGRIGALGDVLGDHPDERER